jgi:hypothetical protein
MHASQLYDLDYTRAFAPAYLILVEVHLRGFFSMVFSKPIMVQDRKWDTIP